jgi:hypothetical protein
MFTLESLLVAQEANSIFSGFDPDHRFVLTIIGIGCSTALVMALGGAFLGVWHSVKEKQIEADLKRDMLDRGMNAEEIQQVIEAKPKTGFDRWMGSWCKK